MSRLRQPPSSGVVQACMKKNRRIKASDVKEREECRVESPSGEWIGVTGGNKIIDKEMEGRKKKTRKGHTIVDREGSGMDASVITKMDRLEREN